MFKLSRSLLKAAGLAVLCVVTVVGAAPVHAQKAEKSEKPAPSAKKAAEKSQAPGTPPSAWAVTCSDRGQAAFKCEMTQTLIDEKSRGPIAVLSVTQDGTATSMVMRVPHGVYLPSGLTMKVDQGDVKKLDFQRSDAAGVYAGVALDDKSIANMSQGKALVLGMDLGPGRPIEFPARLDGFGPALQRLSSSK